MDRGALAPGEIWTAGALLHIREANRMTTAWTTPRCTWLTMTYMDATGTVRAIEFPAGNDITVTAEDIPAALRYCSGTEVDIMAMPPVDLSALSGSRGFRLTIEVRSSREDGILVQSYGRP